jgi:hypothetical protein
MATDQSRDQMHQQRMAHTDVPLDTPQIASAPVSSPGGLSRRGFLGRAGGVVAATMAAGALAGLPSAYLATVAADDIGPVNDQVRANQAFQIRVHVAQDEHSVPLPDHPTNGDEALYANRIGNYCKGLRGVPGNDLAEVDPSAYTALIRALTSGQPADFENIPLGGGLKLANPQAAYAFILEGPD